MAFPSFLIHKLITVRCTATLPLPQKLSHVDKHAQFVVGLLQGQYSKLLGGQILALSLRLVMRYLAFSRVLGTGGAQGRVPPP